MRDTVLKALAISSTIGGTVAGLVLRTQVDISSDTGALVGFFSIVATPVGIIIGFLLFLTLSQHAGTREKLEELYALVLALPNEDSRLRSKIQNFRANLENLGNSFGGENSFGKGDDFYLLLAMVPSEFRLELSDRWRKLVAVATTRIPTALWIALFATNFFSSLLVGMVQFTPLTTAIVLVGWNVLFGGLTVLIADFDNPFDGWFNIKNPFAV